MSGRKKGSHEEKVCTKAVQPDEEGKDAAMESVDEVARFAMEEARKELFEEYLCSMETPHVVESAMKELKAVLEVAFRRPDAGVSEGDLNENPSWDLRTMEPPPRSEIDAWARNAIPKVQTKKTEALKESVPPIVQSPKLPSEAGRSKTRSSVSRFRKAKNVIRSNNKAGTSPKKGELPAYIVKLEAKTRDLFGRDIAETLNLSSTEKERTLKKKPAEVKVEGDTCTGNENRGSIDDEDDGERKKKSLEEREERQRARKLVESLKGKDFVLDDDGELIMVQKVAGDSLPRRIQDLKHNVSSQQLEQEQESEGTEDRRETAGAEKDCAKGKEKFYKASASFQQSVLKNPALHVKAGVTFREDGEHKAGPPFAGDSKKMTREEFKQHQSVLESQFVGDNSSAVASKKNFERESFSHREEGDTVGLIDSVEKEENYYDEEDEQGEAHSAPQLSQRRRLSERSSSKDGNLELVRSPDWGDNRNRSSKPFDPPPHPCEPHENGVESPTFVSSPRGPRDRVVSESNSVMHERLPPPKAGSPKLLEPSSPQPTRITTFQSVSDTGSVKIESDRAYRILGLPQNKANR